MDLDLLKGYAGSVRLYDQGKAVALDDGKGRINLPDAGDYMKISFRFKMPDAHPEVAVPVAEQKELLLQQFAHFALNRVPELFANGMPVVQEATEDGTQLLTITATPPHYTDRFGQKLTALLADLTGLAEGKVSAIGKRAR